MATLEHIINAAASTHSRERAREFFAECDEVERLVDRLSLGVDAQRPASGIELSLVHNHVLANPTRSPATSTLRCVNSGTSRATCNCFCHLILRLYKR